MRKNLKVIYYPPSDLTGIRLMTHLHFFLPHKNEAKIWYMQELPPYGHDKIWSQILHSHNHKVEPENQATAHIPSNSITSSCQS